MKRIGFFLLVNFFISISFFMLTKIFNWPWYFTLVVFALGIIGGWIYSYVAPTYIQFHYKIKPNKYPYLINLVQELGTQANLTYLPQLCFYQSPKLNIFTIGTNEKNAIMILSTASLHYLTSEQLKAIIAHEIAHIKTGDMMTMTLLQGSLYTFSSLLASIPIYFINLALNLSGYEEKRKQKISMISYWVLNNSLRYSLTLFGMLFVNAFSRYREFRADKISAELVGHENMIAALKRLQDALQFEDNNMASLAALQISHRPHWLKIFSTHPLLQKRIHYLMQTR